MAGNVTELRPKQEEAILALLSNRSVEDAARAVKIGPRTLYRWLNEPSFDKAYRQTRRKAFGQSTARLLQASGAAVSTTLKVMAGPGSSASERLRAAEMVLSHAAKSIETEEIVARLLEIERKIQASPSDSVDGKRTRGASTRGALQQTASTGRAGDAHRGAGEGDQEGEITAESAGKDRLS